MFTLSMAHHCLWLVNYTSCMKSTIARFCLCGFHKVEELFWDHHKIIWILVKAFNWKPQASEAPNPDPWLIRWVSFSQVLLPHGAKRNGSDSSTSCPLLHTIRASAKKHSSCWFSDFYHTPLSWKWSLYAYFECLKQTTGWLLVNYAEEWFQKHRNDF